MFDLKIISDRFYEVQLPSGKLLHLEAPKLKTLRKVEKAGESIDALAGAVAQLMGKNRENYKVSADDVLDWMDIDQCSAFLTDFLGWVNGEKDSDPN